MFAFELIFLNFPERLFYETLCWCIKWWTMCEIHPFQRHVASSIWNIHKVYAKLADVTSVCNFKSLLVTIVHKTVHSETAHGPFQKIRFINYSCQTPTNFRFTTSITSGNNTDLHDDVIKWKHFPPYWSFVRGFDRSPANSPRKGQGRWALIFYLICTLTEGLANNRNAGDLRCHHAH